MTFATVCHIRGWICTGLLWKHAEANTCQESTWSHIWCKEKVDQSRCRFHFFTNAFLFYVFFCEFNSNLYIKLSRWLETLCGHWFLPILMDILLKMTKNTFIGLCKYFLTKNIAFQWWRRQLILFALQFQWKHTKRWCVKGGSDCAVFATIPSERNWIPSPYFHFVQTKPKTRLQ